MAIHKFYWNASIAALMLFLRTAFSDINIAPSSSEVQRGGSTYFNCSTSITSKEVHWFHYTVSSTERTFVYGFGEFYNPYLGRFAIDINVTTGEYNLVITSVVAEDAGKYECQDDAGGGMKKSAHLIILDTDLTCQSSVNVEKVIGPNSCGIAPDQLILTCMAQYHGNEAPILQWELNATNKPITNGVTRETIGNRVMYNLTTATDELLDGSFYACRTTRSTTKISCHSGNVQVVGSLAYNPASLPSEVCKPYIKPYSDAIICIIMIVLPVAIAGTVFVLWYLLAYRPKKKRQKDNYLQEMQQRKLLDGPKKEKTSESDVKLGETADNKKPLQSGECNDDLKSNIKTSEKYVRALLQRIQEQDKSIKNKDQTISSLNQQDQSNAEKINVLQSENNDLRAKIIENDQLQAYVKDLEQRLYPKGNVDYAEKPTLAHTINTDAGSQRREPINGMAILGKELFVSHENNSLIEVYDAETFQFGREWALEAMSHPLDIASCKIANCLFVIFRGNSESESHIMKLYPERELKMKWSTGGERGRLSTYESNVIVCLFEKQLINEFNGDGKLIHTVHLSPAVGFVHPWQAIKVTSSHFAVSHGDSKDELHRVCIVDVQGNIITELREWQNEFTVGKLNVPICLVEDSERSIIVADRDNKKIRRLNGFLKRQKDLIKKGSGLDGHPVRICLDEGKGRLFVAENTFRSNKKELKDVRILVFNIK